MTEVVRFATRTLIAVNLLMTVPSPSYAQLRVSSVLSSFSDVDGAIGLTRQTQIGIAADQSVVMVDISRDGLYLLSASLSSLRRVGRKGFGPGEYQNIASFGWLGDTLWASDDRTTKITFVDKLGNGKARSHPFRGLTTTTSFMSQPIALTPDGMAISVMLGGPARGGFALTQMDPILRFPLGDATKRDTLLLLDPRNRTQLLQLEGTRVSGTQLMSDATLWALSRNGMYAAKVERSDEAAQQQHPPVLTVLRTDGRVIHKTFLSQPRERVSRTDINTLVARKVKTFNANFASAGWVPQLTAEAAGRGMFVPRYRISVVDVVLGDDGTVLLRGNDWTTADVEYTWFNPNGTVRGTFRVPHSQLVRGVLGKNIWSIAEQSGGEVRLIRQTVN